MIAPTCGCNYKPSLVLQTLDQCCPGFHGFSLRPGFGVQMLGMKSCFPRVISTLPHHSGIASDLYHLEVQFFFAIISNWCVLTFYLTLCLSVSGIYFDILSDNPSGIYSRIGCGSFYLTVFLASTRTVIMAFCLASAPTFSLPSFLAVYIKDSLWDHSWHLFWHAV